MMWKTFTVLLALTVGAFTPPASGLETGVNSEPAIVAAMDKKWTATELQQLSLGPDMAAVVSRMYSAEGDDGGVTKISGESFQERVGKVAVADLRAGILAVATSGKTRKNNKLAEFAYTEDPVATCADLETAAWGGYDNCAESCTNSGRYFQRASSQEGACHVLCALAIDPCKNLSWASMAMTWAGTTKAMLVGMVPPAVASLKEGMARVNNLVVTNVRNADMGSLLLLVLGLLLAERVGIDYAHMSALRSWGRQAESDLLAGQWRIDWLEKHSLVSLPRRMKDRQFGVYANGVISDLENQGVSKAKIAAAERREARDSLAAAAAAVLTPVSTPKKA